jgi:hypothetical protein
MGIEHVQTFEGAPPPADVFEPYHMGVELLSDMDELFESARRIVDSGDYPGEQIQEGQRAVAIVTPGRLVMFDKCPPPGSVEGERIAPMRELMPPEPPLKISVISHTRIEALVENIDKAIPFRGFLNGWAYLGHSIVVFEGNLSAFESGIRGSDVLIIDSGMLPFIRRDWRHVARRVMAPGAKILIHDRETYRLSPLNENSAAATAWSGDESDYVELMLSFLIGGPRASVEITSSCPLPELSHLATDPEVLNWLGQEPFKPEINANRVIAIILDQAGWRWYNAFFKTGGLLRVPYTDTKGNPKQWRVSVSVAKAPQRGTRLLIER